MLKGSKINGLNMLKVRYEYIKIKKTFLKKDLFRVHYRNDAEMGAYASVKFDKDLLELNPPLFFQVNGDYYLGDGFRRVSFFSNSLPFLLYAPVFCSDDYGECLRLALYMNLYSYNDLDRIYVIEKIMKKPFCFDRDCLSEILPLLGVFSSDKNIALYNAFLSAPDSLKADFYNGRINLKSIAVLSKLGSADMEVVYNSLLKKIRFSYSETVYLADLLVTIKRVKLKTLEDIFCSPEFRDILRYAAEGNTGNVKSAIIKYLKSVAYPNVSMCETEISNVEKLFGKNVRFTFDMWPEKNDLTVSFKVGDMKSFEKIIGLLSKNIGAVNKLFDIRNDIEINE